MAPQALADSATDFWRGSSETTFDRDYWLAHSQGYRVESVGGRVGFVEDVICREGLPVELVVRAGRLGTRLLAFRAVDVAFVVPRAERIFLASSATPVRDLRPERTGTR